MYPGIESTTGVFFYFITKNLLLIEKIRLESTTSRSNIHGVINEENGIYFKRIVIFIIIVQKIYNKQICFLSKINL